MHAYYKELRKAQKKRRQERKRKGAVQQKVEEIRVVVPNNEGTRPLSHTTVKNAGEPENEKTTKTATQATEEFNARAGNGTKERKKRCPACLKNEPSPERKTNAFCCIEDRWRTGSKATKISKRVASTETISERNRSGKHNACGIQVHRQWYLWHLLSRKIPRNHDSDQRV